MNDAQLAARLRRANPVLDAEAPPRALLEIALRPARRQRPTRRWLLAVAVVAVLVGGGLAVAHELQVRYFDAAAPVSASIRAVLAEESTHYGYPGPRRRLDVDRALQVYEYSAGRATLTMYAAPYEGGAGGWCAAAYRDDVELGANCVAPGVNRRVGGSLTAALGASITFWHWKDGLQDDARAIVGRLPAGANSARLLVRFEDGTTADLSQGDGWFAYVVRPENLTVGHRPVELQALGGAGHVLGRTDVDPFMFDARATARAMVGASDGSPGQNAIRAQLLDLSVRLGDGGHEASLVNVSGTRLVRTLPLADGTRIDVYAAEGRADASYPQGVLLIAGVQEPGSETVFGGGGAGGGARWTSFVDIAGGPVSLPGPAAPSPYLELYGALPRGVARVAVRLEDGSERPVDLVAKGDWYVWLERAVFANEGHRPVALVGRDDAGATVVTTPLDPASCLTRSCRPRR